MNNYPEALPARRRHSTYSPARLLYLLVLVLGLNSAVTHAEPQYWVYTVRPGDNIWNLTDKYCTSVLHWKRVQVLNNVRLDRQIPPGTKLLFPMDILKYQPASAQVVQVRGSAQLLHAGSQSGTPLKAGTELRSGDRIVTSAGANVSVNFADGSELLILESSEVVMDTLSAWGRTGMVDTRVRLQGGRVNTRVKPSQGPGSRYHIITPAAVAAVRGTQFRVAAADRGAVTRSEVTEGTVNVGAQRNGQAIEAGYGLVSEAGKPPQAPRQLLPAPDLGATAARQRTLPLQFEWAAQPGAKGYRLQIAPNQRFETLIANQLTDKPRLQWHDLPDGRYALRVRAIDELGLEGLDSIMEFEVDVRPLAPQPVVLGGGTLTREARPQFAWKSDTADQSYRFELATDPEFRQLVKTTLVDGRQTTLTDPLKGGEYFWRVASVTPAGEQGPFSGAQHFVYRPPIGMPQVIRAPVIDDATVEFDWQAVDNAVAYRFQLSADPEFREIVAEQRVTEPRVVIERPASKVYFFRISAENAQAETSPFTQARELEVPPHNYWGLLILLLPLLVAL